MTTYLCSGQDRNGNRVVLRIQAERAEQARKELESRGYTHLTLHSDEIVDAMVKHNQAVQLLPADRQLEFRNRGRVTWSEILGGAIRDYRRPFVGLMAFFALGRKRTRRVCCESQSLVEKML
jgi:hypothetical protein